MKQITIKKSISIVGIGLHKGVSVNVEVSPLPPDSGIVFRTKNIKDAIRLEPNVVKDTKLATTIANNCFKVSTIEHFMSAIYAYGIDNLEVCIDNEEFPIMDGSAISFCLLLDEAGLQVQDKEKKFLKIKQDICVQENNKYAKLEPSSCLSFDYKIHFDHPMIKTQEYSFIFSSQAYKSQIARARTFGFVHEVQYLRSKGLALGASTSNAIALDKDSILNKNGLRFKDEFVRHKILDAIGDIALLGLPIMGKYTSFAGSHDLNHKLTKEILKNQANYEIVEYPSLELNKDLNVCYAHS